MKSYVIGSSRQIGLLTEEEKQFLDSERYVFVCNDFLRYWRKAGFRPTHWVMGDTFDSGLEVLTAQLRVIRQDGELRKRLRQLFICFESLEAIEILKEFLPRIKLPIVIYRRYDNKPGKMAVDLSERIYHYGSTLTDMVNIAWIVNWHNQVRVYGCELDGKSGHFYDPLEDVVPFKWDSLWVGLNDLFEQGVDVVDCNRRHGSKMDFPIPTNILIGEAHGRTWNNPSQIPIL